MPALFALFILGWLLFRFGPLLLWASKGCPCPDDDE